MVGAVSGGFWAENLVNNTKIAQSAVWLPVHMGNVGLAIEPDWTARNRQACDNLSINR